MRWVLPLLMAVLGLIDFMHRIAATLAEPNCFRFLLVANSLPDGALNAADRASFLVNAEKIAFLFGLLSIYYWYGAETRKPRKGAKQQHTRRSSHSNE
jgi:hypothetical protein